MTNPDPSDPIGCVRRLAVVALMAALAAILISGVTGVLAAKNAQHLAGLRDVDKVLSREAAARQCARGNLTRAEQHAANRGGVGVLSPNIRRLIRAEPIIDAILTIADQQRQVRLERIRRSQPILDCTPNLVGKEATPLAKGSQERFVDLYVAGRLDPTPEADDVLKGFDTEIEPQSQLPGG